MYPMLLTEGSAGPPVSNDHVAEKKPEEQVINSNPFRSRFAESVSLSLLLLLCLDLVNAMPRLPKGMPPAEYYGGFYPDEKWVDALKSIARDRRENPFQSICVVEDESEGKDSWQSPTIRLTQEQLQRLKEEAKPYLKLKPKELLGLVPRRNRISGNSRVMRASRMPPCPVGDGELLTWSPDRADELACARDHTIDPFKLYRQTGIFRIRGPKGEEQEYPYNDAEDGTRTYLLGEFMHPLRVHHLSEAARDLGHLYLHTRDLEYARRAAAILLDFAVAVPHWPKIHRGWNGVEGIDRFRSVDDFSTYTGIWYDKYHSGINAGPDVLALAYDCIVNAPVWKEFDSSAPGNDARRLIEEDLFLYTAKDAIRYDIRHPRPSSAISNYIPYQISGMLCIGRATGMPELIHYAAWKLDQLLEKTLMADSVFPESPSYGRQHIYGMAKAARMGEGYSDPDGFRSSIGGGRFENLDMGFRPQLSRAVETLESMVYPDNNYVMIHDTYGKLLSKGHPAPEKTSPTIYPTFGHAWLGRGERASGNQIQAHLHYSGNWGHDHTDMLDVILWAYRDEMISDIGYTHTYRSFASWSSGHNVVVVDRHTQKQVPDHGNLIGWHSIENAVQVVEASAPEVYEQCSVYRRALFLVPLGDDNVVVDVFTVEGGSVHEWMAQGSCMFEQSMELSIPLSEHGESYADDKKPFTPPAFNEYVKSRRAAGKHPYRLEPGEKDPWYGVFRDVRRADVKGPLTGNFYSRGKSQHDLRFHILFPSEGTAYACTVPSLRRCWSQKLRKEIHADVEKYRMPKIVIRRDGQNLRSRFVTVWEPIRNKPILSDVRSLTEGDKGPVVVQLKSKEHDWKATIHYSDGDRVQQTVGDVTWKGRYASIIEQDGQLSIDVYDSSYLQHGSIELKLEPWLPLVLNRVIESNKGKFSLELQGRWPGVERGGLIKFDPAELATIQVGDGQRLVPVDALEIAGEKTVLRCTRHPGFTFDREGEKLKDTFTPYLTYEGKATVRLPSRFHLRSVKGRKGAYLIRSTNPMTIGRSSFGRTEDWSEIQVP